MYKFLLIYIYEIISICKGITITRSAVVTIHAAFARSISKLYIEGGTNAVNPTGIEVRIRITFKGSPLSIFPNPSKKAIPVATNGTIKNFMTEISIAGLIKAVTLLNFIAIPMEISNSILDKGMTIALRLL